jgi:hypothetical protein
MRDEDGDAAGKQAKDSRRNEPVGDANDREMTRRHLRVIAQSPNRRVTHRLPREKARRSPVAKYYLIAQRFVPAISLSGRFL